MNWLSVKCVLGLPFAILACTNETAELGVKTEFTDSAGIQIAFTRIGQDAPTCDAAREFLRIGSVDETSGTALFGVNGAAVLGDGQLAVVNRGSSQIKVFSPSGELVTEFGRQGQGPEEFKNLWSVHVRGQDTLVVGDYRPWRFSFFTPGGVLIRRIELKPAVIERPDFAIPLNAGAGFIMEDPVFSTQDQMVDRIVPLRVYSEDGELSREVGDFWMDEFGYLAKEIGYVGNPIFGARASFSFLREDLILYGSGRYEQIETWSVHGDLRGILRWESRDRTVKAGDADAWRRKRRSEIEARTEITPQMAPIINAQIGEHLPVADVYPGHDQVVVSQDHHIWVNEYRRPLDDGPDQWWVFDADHRFVCSARLPTDFRVMAITHDRVYGLVRDSLDVEYIVGYEIGYPAASLR